MEKNIQYPYHVSPVPRQRPILPLFPHGYLPQGYAPQKEKPKQAPKLSSRRRKSYRRSVLHKAALAVPTLPPPVVGSLRQAAQACVQRLQAASALPSTPSGYKRPFSDSSSPSPSNLPPLPQRIRKDIQIEESEVESPEKETLRSAPILGNSPTPVSPLVKDFPSPAPLVLTPVPPKMMSCLNCEEEMTPGHQCVSTDSESNWEDVESDVQSEDWAEQFTNSIRRFHGLNPKVTPLKKTH